MSTTSVPNQGEMYSNQGEMYSLMDIMCWKNKLHVQLALLSTIHVVSSSWCSKGIFHVIHQT